MAKFRRTTCVSAMSIALVISYSFFQIVTANDNETALVEQTTPRASAVTERIPIDLYDLGYYDGDWEKFCDREGIFQEFQYYPGHELRKVRIEVCRRVLDDKKFNNETLAWCALYKYCLMMTPRADEFIEAFVDRFSMNDTKKKEDLIRYHATLDETTSCYKTSIDEFEKKCIAKGNAFHSTFKQIFARACTYAELTTEVILSTIEEVCRDKFMTDKVNWFPYYATIGFKF